MSNFDFIGYMRNMATKLKDIQHVEGDTSKTRFYRISSLDNPDEIFQRITEFKNFNIVVEDNDEGNMVHANCLDDKQMCSFFVVQKAKVNDATDRERVKKACKAVMLKVLAKVYADYMIDNNNPITNQIGLRNVDFNGWQYNTFGPILDSYYGVHTVFTVLNPINVKLDPNDWLP